jgi:hypothetical protein
LVSKSLLSRLISLKPFFSSVHSMIGIISNILLANIRDEVSHLILEMRVRK